MENEFRKKLRMRKQYDIVKILDAQRNIDININDESKVHSILNKLTAEERKVLAQLYDNQIFELKSVFKDYKNRIITERKQLGVI